MDAQFQEKFRRKEAITLSGLSLDTYCNTVGNTVDKLPASSQKCDVSNATSTGPLECLVVADDSTPCKCTSSDSFPEDPDRYSFDLTVRTFNTLKRAGIKSLPALMKKTEDEIKQIRNMTPESLQEIIDKMEELGLSFAQDT